VTNSLVWATAGMSRTTQDPAITDCKLSLSPNFKGTISLCGAKIIQEEKARISQPGVAGTKIEPEQSHIIHKQAQKTTPVRNMFLCLFVAKKIL